MSKDDLQKVVELFNRTRADRLYYRSQKTQTGGIEAAGCAIREAALLDALSVLGYDRDRIKRMRKLH